MIDWLSWPLAQNVDTWVIALLKGLAAVQKFTILIDVTLLKIELVCKANPDFIYIFIYLVQHRPWKVESEVAYFASVELQ